MVIPAPASKPRPVLGEDGQVIEYIVPADELDRLQAQVESLSEQVAKLQKQKDRYAADFERLLKSSIPIPPTEAEMREAAATPNGLGNLIAELEARQERE